jgi:hypothetical protein
MYQGVNQMNELKWTKKQLWKGCILASIAHAIMVAHYPDLSNEHSWDGINYNVQDNAGSRGTITFHHDNFVAAFRNDNSNRFIMGSLLDEYFIGVKKEIVELANTETLQYLLEKVDGDGQITPVISTAIWGSGNKLFSGDTFDEMLRCGGFLLKKQVLDLNSAIEAWNKYYDMSKQQLELLKSIYDRKIASYARKIFLDRDEMKMIGTDAPDSLYESKISFEEIDIAFED